MFLITQKKNLLGQILLSNLQGLNSKTWTDFIPLSEQEISIESTDGTCRNIAQTLSQFLCYCCHECHGQKSKAGRGFIWLPCCNPLSRGQSGQTPKAGTQGRNYGGVPLPRLPTRLMFSQSYTVLDHPQIVSSTVDWSLLRQSTVKAVSDRHSCLVQAVLQLNSSQATLGYAKLNDS